MVDLYNEVFIIVFVVFVLGIVPTQIGLAFYARKQRLLRDPNEEPTSEGANLKAGVIGIIYGLHAVSLGILFALATFKGIASYLCYHVVVCDVAELIFAFVIICGKLNKESTNICVDNGDPLKTCIVVIRGLHIITLGFPFGMASKILFLVWFEERFSVESCSPTSTLDPIPSVRIFIPLYLAAIPLVLIPFVVICLRQGYRLSGWESICQFGPMVRIGLSFGLVAAVCLWIAASVEMVAILDGRQARMVLAVPSILLLWIPLIAGVTTLLYWTVKLGYFLLFLPEFGYLWSLLLGSVGLIYRLDTGQSPCVVVQAFICVYAAFTFGYFVLCMIFTTSKRNVMYEKTVGFSQIWEASDRIFTMRRAVTDIEINPMATYSLYSNVSHAVLTTAVRDLMSKTWSSSVVSVGRDAKGLNHSDFKINHVIPMSYTGLRKQFEAFKTSMKIKYKGTDELGKIGEFKVNGNKPAPVLTSTQGVSLFDKNLDQSVNEVYLFHGTKPQAVEGIKENGFSVQMGATGMLGKAIYFAESSSKSDQYADSKTSREDINRNMFLVRVCLGRTYVTKTRRQFDGLPCVDKNCMTDNCKIHPRKFDSVMFDDDHGLYREFIVFNPTQCYPEFHIIYDRQ